MKVGGKEMEIKNGRKKKRFKINNYLTLFLVSIKIK